MYGLRYVMLCCSLQSPYIQHFLQVLVVYSSLFKLLTHSPPDPHQANAMQCYCYAMLCCAEWLSRFVLA